MKALLVTVLLVSSCATRGRAPALTEPAADPAAAAPAADPGAEIELVPPPPGELHPFLQRFVGTWDVRNDVPAGPNGAPRVMYTMETIEALGPWIHSSITSLGSGEYTARLAIAHDPDRGFTGAWVDSSNPTLWIYRCWLGKDGRTFTAEAQGPALDDPARITKFQNITEFAGENRRLLRSRTLGPGGSWIEFSSGVAVKR